MHSSWVGGCRRVLNEAKRHRLYKLYDEVNPDGSKKYAIKEICEMMNVSKSTLYAYLGSGRLIAIMAVGCWKQNERLTLLTKNYTLIVVELSTL